jgi:hypothetical protein
MNSKEIQNNFELIFEDFPEKEFIYNLLMAYCTSKASEARLKKRRL